jgi:hypothetical protein
MFSGSQRVGVATAECLGAMGASILACDGATLPHPDNPERKKPQRDGRGAPAKGSLRGPTYAGLVLPTWAEALLSGTESIYTGAQLSEDQHKLVLRCVKAFLVHCGKEVLPLASMRVARMCQRLLDANQTEARHLQGYLELMKAASAGWNAHEVAQMLPDMLDVLLGWAVDPATPHACRRVHATTSAGAV